METQKQNPYGELLTKATPEVNYQNIIEGYKITAEIITDENYNPIEKVKGLIHSRKSALSKLETLSLDEINKIMLCDSLVSGLLENSNQLRWTKEVIGDK